jgi:hypothetical protein
VRLQRQCLQQLLGRRHSTCQSTFEECRWQLCAVPKLAPDQQGCERSQLCRAPAVNVSWCNHNGICGCCCRPGNQMHAAQLTH